MKASQELGLKIEGWQTKSNKGMELAPIQYFEKLPNYEQIKPKLGRHEWNRPTLIQSYAIPIILMNRDLIGISATGSGKTLAYALPLSYLTQKVKNTRTLVLAPTRELAKQISFEFEKLMPGNVGCVYGGVPKYIQRPMLHKTVLVGTPGRLSDFLSQQAMEFDFVVIDQVDKILEGNFIEQLDSILNYIGTYERMFMFSATVTQDVKVLSRKYMKEPVTLTIGGNTSYNPRIIQEFYEINHQRFKEKQLLNLIDGYRNQKVLVFTNTKNRAFELKNSLQRQLGERVIYMTGDVPQDLRERFMDKFKKSRCNILVATDVASRGLDVKNIQLVVNYDMPKDLMTYTHRIGRTARYNKKGNAVTFVVSGRESQFILSDLVEYLIKCRQKPAECLVRMAHFSETRIQELKRQIEALKPLEENLPPPEYDRPENYEDEDEFKKKQEYQPRYRERVEERYEGGRQQKKQQDEETFKKIEPEPVSQDQEMSFIKGRSKMDDLADQSFSDLSFRKKQKQSFIEDSRLSLSKRSILQDGKKVKRFNCNNYKPYAFRTYVTLANNKNLEIVHGKWHQMEGCLLVVGKSSSEYEQMKSMVNNWQNKTQMEEMKSILKLTEENMQKNAICFNNLTLLQNYSQGCVFIQTSRIKKQFIWKAMFKEIGRLEALEATICLPISGNPAETPQDIDSILKQIAAQLVEQKVLKQVRIMLSNQKICTAYLQGQLKIM